MFHTYTWYVIAMRFVLHTFFNLFLIVSLAAMPLRTVLASVDDGHELFMNNSANAEPCHNVMGEQDLAPLSTDSHYDASLAGHCNHSDGDCACPDSAGCHSVVVSPGSALAGMSLTVPVQARDDFVVIWRHHYFSLDLPPDSPPPVV